MPRAKNWIRRHVSVTETLDPPTQWNLCWGHCFGIRDITSRAHLAEAWRRHGERLMGRYIAAFPGSRPMACYLLGSIRPLPQPVQSVLRHPLLIEGCNPVETAGHQQQAEFDHLIGLGLVDPAEEQQARKRLAQPDAYSPRRFI